MKRLIFLCVFLCALAVPSFAQSASDITVSGTLYNSFNDACTSCTFTVTVTRRDGVAIQSSARTVTSHASTGAVSFTLPRKSFVTFTGNYTVGRYSWKNGISLFIPDQSTIDIVDLQSVEDASAALVAVSSAPSDAQYIVATANSTLSAEQSLGALTTGLLKNTVSGSTGTLSTATAGTDYENPLTFAARLSRSTNTIDLAASGVTAGTCTACDLTIDTYGRVTAKASGSGGPGTVSSVAQSFTGGLISVSGSPITTSGTLALTVAGTSGGIPYFSSASAWASSGALTANALMIGGGAGSAPSTTTTGTGVVTALGVNTGSAGAFVVNGGALGTPSSGTLTNATGLPISTGVSGLGTGVATFLATPSSANLASALTDETGTGAVVFGTSPDFTTGATIGGVAIPTISSTNTLTNKTISGASNTLSNIGNSSLTNSAITIAGSSTSLGGSITASTILDSIGSTRGTVLYRGVSGWAALTPGTSGQFLQTQGAGADPQWAAGGGGITVGTTTVTGGTNTRVLFNNSGVVGEYAVTGTGNAVLSASPTLTGTVAAAAATFSGAITQTSASATAFVSGLNGATTPAFVIDNSTASQASGMKVIGKADGTAPELKSISRTQTTASIAGNGISITADPAIAGSLSAGAAAGGNVTITAGDAARLTSGNANGGTINLTTGSGIGTGTSGNVLQVRGSYVFEAESNSGVGLVPRTTSYGIGPALMIQGGGGASSNHGLYTSYLALTQSTTDGGVSLYAQAASNYGIVIASTALYGFSSSSGTSATGLRDSRDTLWGRAGAANLRLGNTDAASPVAQTLSVQNVVAGATNTAGATWTHQASLGTSQGAPGRHSFTAGALITASGTTQQTAVSRLELGATKVLTNNSATTIVNVTDASNTSTGGVMDYCVEVFDGTDTQYECGMATYGISNKGGAFSGNTVTKFGNHQNATAGTLTVTIAISAANPGVLSVNANSSLTPSTGYPRITYSLRNLGQQAVSVQ